MWMARCDRSRWHYSPRLGLIGIVAAGAVLIAMRHDLTQALTLGVAITSGVGWTRRSTVPGAARRSGDAGDTPGG